MKTIEYRITYLEQRDGVVDRHAFAETVRVQARDINSGYRKALKLALQPLGNGTRRELSRVEFWQFANTHTSTKESN